MSAIEWTDVTWNPVTGCTRVSDGCLNCYIERTPPMRIAGRRFDGHRVGATTGVVLHPDRLNAPLRWQTSRRVFVNSMSDLFHKDVSAEFIADVFAVMALTPQHTYQILTKRHGRMRFLLSSPWFWHLVAVQGGKNHISSQQDWPAVASMVGGDPLPNVWLGVSVEDQRWADSRIPALLETPAAVRFVSCEPLLTCVDLTRVHNGALVDALTGHAHTELYQQAPATLDWVIAGGESGPGARPMHPDCARELRDQCQQAGTPFFFKQWGSWALADCEESRPTCRWVSKWCQDDGPHRYVPGAPMHRMGFAHMHNVGKSRAGRTLDGRTWDEYPQAVAS